MILDTGNSWSLERSTCCVYQKLGSGTDTPR
ncbi:uncharacterized protein FTOL_12877 [Fusarium torulosum]|uniref:Uncharacterized protein n=1 Tax=Fusarium torulosum TaxID=33205 RepID=A0AAE8MKS1_9HYPO|nr:uncharacterized protein FTOL_12877 [Fusarium torulosum]